MEHVNLLHERIKQFDTSCDTMCSKKSSYNDCRVLVATTQKAGRGFDQATFCKNYSGHRYDMLILCFSIKKYQLLTQNVGRVLRADEPHVVHLVDDDGIFTSHWTKCQQWYKNRKAIISIHHVNDGQIDMTHNVLKIDDNQKQVIKK